MTAIAVSNTLSDVGTRAPSKATIARAKAMSVAAGIAQPRRWSASPAFIAMKISAGTTIPATAAAPGRMRRPQDDKWPTRNSCFTSSPTSRKKSAISPSLIQCVTVRPAMG